MSFYTHDQIDEDIEIDLDLSSDDKYAKAEAVGKSSKGSSKGSSLLTGPSFVIDKHVDEIDISTAA